jgi:serine/threonine-protein kinase
MGLEPGAVVGAHELVAPVASGGVGSVWAALPKGSGEVDKLVAIKALLPEFAGDAHLQHTFALSAVLASRIKHPNVVAVLSARDDGPASYQVLEWVNGESLAMLMQAAAKRKGTPLRVAARIVSQLCSGLHAAHELRSERGEPLGLVHRDMSPSKMLVGVDGVVKIFDFGKAKHSVKRKSPSVMLAKAAFMAPETVADKDVDRRADVFALGALFYQLVCGEHPFSADDDGAILDRIASSDEATPLKTKSPRVSDELSELVCAALAKSPAARPGSADELRLGIESAIAEAADSETNSMVADYLRMLAKNQLDARAREVREAIQRLTQVRRGTGLARAWGVATKRSDGDAEASSRRRPSTLPPRPASTPTPAPAAAPPAAPAALAPKSVSPEAPPSKAPAPKSLPPKLPPSAVRAARATAAKDPPAKLPPAKLPPPKLPPPKRAPPPAVVKSEVMTLPPPEPVLAAPAKSVRPPLPPKRTSIASASPAAAKPSERPRDVAPSGNLATPFDGSVLAERSSGFNPAPPPRKNRVRLFATAGVIAAAAIGAALTMSLSGSRAAATSSQTPSEPPTEAAAAAPEETNAPTAVAPTNEARPVEPAPAPAAQAPALSETSEAPPVSEAPSRPAEGPTTKPTSRAPRHVEPARAAPAAKTAAPATANPKNTPSREFTPSHL